MVVVLNVICGKRQCGMIKGLLYTDRTGTGSLKYAYPIEVFHKTVDVLKGFHHIPGHGAVGLN